MGKLSINEISTKLIKREGLSKKQAAEFAYNMFDVIQKGLEEDRAVKVKGLGTFKIITVDDRESINVNTGERVLIGGHSKITFTPDAMMKELVNRPFSQFETVVLKDGVEFDDIQAMEVNRVAPAPSTDTVPETVEQPKEPVIVQEKIETVSEPIIEETEPKSEPEPEKSSNDEIINKEEPSSFLKKWALPIIFCIIGFATGYLVSNMMHKTPVVSEQPKQVEKTAVKNTEKASSPKSEVKEKPQQEVKPEVKPESKPVVMPEPKKEEKPVVKSDSAPIDMKKYEKMDSRVFYGAYIIVGTDRVVKAKPTDNIAKISKRTLGPGMECYVEVYNGIKSNAVLQPGQEIKIPKLERKSIKKKVNNKNKEE